MTERPAIGERVRILGNTGIPGFAGRDGIVSAHHEDGVASWVSLVGPVEMILCDPSNVCPASASVREFPAVQP